MTNTTKPTDIDALAVELDSKYRFWEIWRTASGGFAIKVTNEHNETETIHRRTIADTFRNAAAFEFLPRIPRRPRLAFYDVEKNAKASQAQRWEIFSTDTNGRQRVTGVNTKKKATEMALTGMRRNREAHDAWMAEYGALVHDGVEGVDFRWK